MQQGIGHHVEPLLSDNKPHVEEADGLDDLSEDQLDALLQYLSIRRKERHALDSHQAARHERGGYHRHLLQQAADRLGRTCDEREVRAGSQQQRNVLDAQDAYDGVQVHFRLSNL